MELPGFELLDKLGEGGMATVWKGRQVSLNRPVAIKILSERLARHQADTERFLSEAQSMAHLKHPGIIQVYDANIHNGVYYFVMEFIAGYSVGDWIRRKKTIPEADALITAEHVANALNYAWESHKVIHCDIKPDNIMIDADGTIKVADMGLARTIGMATVDTAGDEVMGTPNYMSPEQVLGEPDLDCRSDIYSLGAMLYEMVTGQLPFGKLDGNTVMEQHATGQLPDPIDVTPHVSMSTAWLIEKMMAKDRNKRYHTWSAVLTDITRVKRGMMLRDGDFPEGLSTVRRSARRTKPIGHYKMIATTEKKKTNLNPHIFAAVAATILVVGAFVVVLLSSDSGRQPDIPPPKPPPVPGSGQPTEEERAGKLYDLAVQWAAAHPAEFSEAIQRFTAVERETGSADYAKMAGARIGELTAARGKAIAQVLEELKTKTDPLVRDKRFDEAVSVYQLYNGQYVSETADERYKCAVAINGQAESFRKQKDAADSERKLADLLESIAARLVAGEQVKAEQELAAAEADRAMQSRERELSSIKAGLSALRRADARVLESFKGNIGSTIAVLVPAGSRNIKINAVADGKVHGEEKVEKDNYTTMGPVEITLADLSSREILRRLGAAEDDAAVMKKGILALQAGSYSSAKKYLSRIQSTLRDVLCRKASEMELLELNKSAEPELARIVRSLGIEVGDYNGQAWVRAVQAADLAAPAARTVKSRVDSYRSQFGSTAFAHDAEPVLDALVKRAEMYSN